MTCNQSTLKRVEKIISTVGWIHNLSFFSQKCNFVLTWTSEREMAFIEKFTSAVAWPCAHNFLQGAFPEALSELPVPLSPCCANKHNHTYTHTHVHTFMAVITVRAGCAEKTHYRKVALKAFQLAQHADSNDLFLFCQKNRSLPDQRAARWQDGNFSTTCYDINAFIYLFPLISHYFPLLFWDSHILIKSPTSAVIRLPFFLYWTVNDCAMKKLYNTDPPYFLLLPQNYQT